jgi:regulator of ribonuclease activity A
MSERLLLHGTAEICDIHRGSIQVFKPSLLKSYGQKHRCSGKVVTVLLDEDNFTLKSLLQTPGEGRVAIVKVIGEDCAVVGDNLCKFAIDNGWAGMVIEGYVRDTAMLKDMPMAIWATDVYPLRSEKQLEGKIGETFELAGVTVSEGSYFYGDEDGMVLAEKPFEDIEFVK